MSRQPRDRTGDGSLDGSLDGDSEDCLTENGQKIHWVHHWNFLDTLSLGDLVLDLAMYYIVCRKSGQQTLLAEF